MSLQLSIPVALLIGLALAACSASPTTTAEAGNRIEGVKLSSGVQDIANKEGKVELTKDDRVDCERYTPVGSHRAIYRCLTKEEKSREVAENQREMGRITAKGTGLSKSDAQD